MGGASRTRPGEPDPVVRARRAAPFGLLRCYRLPSGGSLSLDSSGEDQRPSAAQRVVGDGGEGSGAKVILVIGSYRHANEKLTRGLAKPGFKVVRVESCEMAEAVVGAFHVDAVVFGADLAPDGAAPIARVVRATAATRAGTKMIALWPVGAPGREELGGLGVLCVYEPTDVETLRQRLHDALASR